ASLFLLLAYTSLFRSHCYFQGLTLAFAPNFHFGLGTWLRCSDNTWQIAHLLDLFAIEFQDYITAAYTSFGSRAIFFNMADQCAFVTVQTNCFGNLIIKDRKSTRLNP